ncbi:MAG: DUF2254 domain-containing protein [Nitriliruptorales bacterium]|nr:DUF2254 domain-containing protein [Nitriliruptorales bacterium]
MEDVRNRRDLAADLAGSLWFLPTTFIVIALAAGAILSSIEVDPDSALGRVAFSGDAEHARQLLIVVTGTMITVTSLVFALTVVALQIASTQFSPRLLRSFLRDRGAQVVLSTFVATVAYAMAGLHTVGGIDASGAVFLPRLAVSGALLLALLSVGMLVYYIHHLTDSIRIDSVMQTIERTTLRLIRRRSPRIDGAGAEAASAPEPPADAVVIPAGRSGYVQRLHLRSLAHQLERHDAAVQLVLHVGWHVTEGRPLAMAWPTGPGPLDEEAVRRALHDQVELATERKTEVDLGFDLRQLVDIANRALAPSLNDPYTAVQAIHHLSVLLSELAQRDLPDVVIEDANGTARVVAPTPSLPKHLEVVCSHLRQSAEGRPRVYVALVRMLENVQRLAGRGEYIDAAGEQLALLEADAERTIPVAEDLREIRAAIARARAGA